MLLLEYRWRIPRVVESWIASIFPRGFADEKPTLVASAAGRLRDLRESVQSRLKSESNYPPDHAPDPSIPSEFSPLVRFLPPLPYRT